MFILSSPSGGGKTTTANLLIQQDKNIVRSISATTRPIRVGEVNGEDYFFYSEDEFHSLCKSNKILEYATVFGNYYGTPKEYIFNTLDQGKDILCCIDWQGAQQITDKMDAVTIFLLPPSLKELNTRLTQRSSDSKEVIACRIQEAREEILHCHEYDYMIINNVIEETLQEVQSIVKSERAKVKNKSNLKYFLQKLDNLD